MQHGAKKVETGVTGIAGAWVAATDAGQRRTLCQVKSCRGVTSRAVNAGKNWGKCDLNLLIKN